MVIIDKLSLDSELNWYAATYMLGTVMFEKKRKSTRKKMKISEAMGRREH